MSEYLHDCHALHGRVTEILYGHKQDIHMIQDRLAHVRSSRRLTYDDVEKIRDSDVWNADMFGYWPPQSDIEALLRSTEWDFWNLPKREDRAINSLLEIFRQIEPVSVILRLVVPEHYGILSPPVEMLLGIGPSRRHKDKYMTYLGDLRRIRNDCAFTTAAEVDMALWVLQVGVLDGLLKNRLDEHQYEDLQEAFQQDIRLREIRVGNLTRQLFNDMSRIELAEALLATNVELAGQIAGIELEKQTGQLIGAKAVRKTVEADGRRSYAYVVEGYGRQSQRSSPGHGSRAHSQQGRSLGRSAEAERSRVSDRCRESR